MKMMYRVLCLLLLISNYATAQIAVKEYFNKDGKTNDVDKSTYYRVGKKDVIWDKQVKRIDTIFIDTVFTFYTKTNTIRSREVYQDGRMEGPYSFYHENGRLQEKGNYKESQKVGYVTYWTDQGTVKKVYQYFYNDFLKREEKGKKESFKIIHYWSEENNQLIKDGAGYCKCYLSEEGPLEEGKIADGYRDSVWRITSGDTLVSTEHYEDGFFLKGESVFKGKTIPYDEVSRQAEFKGGLQGMMKFLQQNIRYPAEAKRSGMQGKVFVKFIVDKEGDLSNLSVIKGVSRVLNDEAVRVIKLMPSWIPATSRGIPVKTQFVLPVYFKLDF
jgi:TonB family protein